MVPCFGSVQHTSVLDVTHTEYERAEFMDKTPKGTDPVVCQFDANAPLRWSGHEAAVLPVIGKANEALGRVAAKVLRVVPPTPKP